MKIPDNKKIISNNELRYGHMASSGYAKWIENIREDDICQTREDFYWEYDNIGYEKYLRTLDLTQAQVNHLTVKYDRKVDLGDVEEAEKKLGRHINIGEKY